MNRQSFETWRRKNWTVGRTDMKWKLAFNATPLQLDRVEDSFT